MNKLLPLVCLSLLPLPAFALLENATVTTKVLPAAEGAGAFDRATVLDERVIAERARETAQLKALVEAQLAQMPDLSGIYTGMVVARLPLGDDAEGREPQLEFFRLARLDEGANRLYAADERGAFEVDMVLTPEGHHWLLEGAVGYREYVGAKRHSQMRASKAVPEHLEVFIGVSRKELQEAAARNAGEPVPETKPADEDRVAGYIYLRTADAPDPKLSPANRINRVTLPSGRVVQLVPGLSAEAAREVIAADLASDKASGAASAVSAD